MSRTISKHENRITVLENENGKRKEEINFLKKQINSLIKKIRKKNV